MPFGDWVFGNHGSSKATIPQEDDSSNESSSHYMDDPDHPGQYIDEQGNHYDRDYTPLDWSD